MDYHIKHYPHDLFTCLKIFVEDRRYPLVRNWN